MSRDAGTIALVGFAPREQNLLEVFFASSDNPGLTLEAPSGRNPCCSMWIRKRP